MQDVAVSVPPPRARTFPHLDGIRGLAALAILGTHGLQPGIAPSEGPVWVRLAAALRLALPCFFLLSAFLLYRPFVAARHAGGPPVTLRRFWWRRVLRIVPAYWVALTVLAAWPGLPGVFGANGWRYYTFLYVYGAHTVDGGLVPAWTLCVDMTFYLVLPLYALGMNRIWRRLAAPSALGIELGVLATIFAAGTAYWFLVVDAAGLTRPALEVREWNLVANLNWFALGMALALVNVSDRGAPSALTRLLGRRHGVTLSWAAAVIVFLFAAWRFAVVSPAVEHLLAAFVCVAVFAPAVLVGERGGLQRALAHPVAVWLGVVSYGVYLYHGPIIGELARLGLAPGAPGLSAYLVPVTVAIPLSVALGWLSYRLIESPLLRRPPRAPTSASPPRTAPVATSVPPAQSVPGAVPAP